MKGKRQIGLGVAGLIWASVIFLGPWADAMAQEVDRTTPAYIYGRYGCGACHGGTGTGTVIGTPIVKLPTGPLTAERIARRGTAA